MALTTWLASLSSTDVCSARHTRGRSVWPAGLMTELHLAGWVVHGALLQADFARAQERRTCS